MILSSHAKNLAWIYSCLGVGFAATAFRDFILLTSHHQCSDFYRQLFVINGISGGFSAWLSNGLIATGAMPRPAFIIYAIFAAFLLAILYGRFDVSFSIYGALTVPIMVAISIGYGKNFRRNKYILAYADRSLLPLVFLILYQISPKVSLDAAFLFAALSVAIILFSVTDLSHGTGREICDSPTGSSLFIMAAELSYMIIPLIAWHIDAKSADNSIMAIQRVGQNLFSLNLVLCTYLLANARHARSPSLKISAVATLGCGISAFLALFLKADAVNTVLSAALFPFCLLSYRLSVKPEYQAPSLIAGASIGLIAASLLSTLSFASICLSLSTGIAFFQIYQARRNGMRKRHEQ